MNFLKVEPATLEAWQSIEADIPCENGEEPWPQKGLQDFIFSASTLRMYPFMF